MDLKASYFGDEVEIIIDNVKEMKEPQLGYNNYPCSLMILAKEYNDCNKCRNTIDEEQVSWREYPQIYVTLQTDVRLHSLEGSFMAKSDNPQKSHKGIPFETDKPAATCYNVKKTRINQLEQRCTYLCPSYKNFS
ncbi:MAG: hypothetical protein K2N01_08790 [Lachnospiraceae bacterium]|nr:hypothetical protein [Lachnospiraceae bacterium]